MEVTKVKEDISISYISAICANAGIGFEVFRHDEDSTDGVIKNIIYLDDGLKFNSQLRIQLKCTSSPSQYSDNGTVITYKLKAKNFNDLVVPSTMPIILGLLILPENEKEWIKWNSDELLIKGCMYWADFSNEKETTNTNSVSVKIDKSNVINSDTLQSILVKIAKEEWS